MPPLTKLAFEFDNSVINAISACNIQIDMQVNDVQPVVNYSQILSAGFGKPLSAKSSVSSFVNISLKEIVQIESGYCSMIALTKHGKVFGRGNNEDGELALGDTNPRNEWTHVAFPNAVKQIAFSHSHALFLTVDSQVFSCGCNDCGQLVG